ncbi:hypothetical protein H9C73_01520 [Marinobacterium sp. AK62]|uniref:GGDEF domain-containing protein n=1 Tax=Marinobacterium alkalitolerans TaxID=1542925 RepID=A0ABS3Z8S7_9GAMM|nr:hypothetical protein [Marinobacterium alkalitolerans]MBP0047399.1 hypothetical protein [Marinobacterium alkalitolerans]
MLFRRPHTSAAASIDAMSELLTHLETATLDNRSVPDARLRSALQALQSRLRESGSARPEALHEMTQSLSAILQRTRLFAGHTQRALEQ